MCVYLRTKFQVSSIILMSFKRGGGSKTPKRTPKKPTLIRVKKDLMRIILFKRNKRLNLNIVQWVLHVY